MIFSFSLPAKVKGTHSIPVSLANFITKKTNCISTPLRFVNPNPTITAGIAAGVISACAGTPSVSPQIQQFTVSGSNLTAGITATAPANFEISLFAGSGYSNSLTITQAEGIVSSSTIYVRSSASASPGYISGSVMLTSGSANQDVAVRGTVKALPVLDNVFNQTVGNGAPTANINFTGTATSYIWTNDRPDIGLAASGTGNIASFTAVNTGSSPVTATITAIPLIVGLAYIANDFSNNVSVINTSTNDVIATVAVGKDPVGVSVNPDGSRAYVSNYGENTVSVISIPDNVVVATIPVGSNPNGITVSPDGSRVYVVSSVSNTVSVINSSSNTVMATITVGALPYGIAVSPDGSRLYVANGNSNTVSVINTATNTVMSAIPAGKTPQGVTVSPDGSRLYVTNLNDANISVINTATKTIVSTIPTGTSPTGIAVCPDGSRLYITNYGSNSVSVINTATNAIVTTIIAGLVPYGVSVTSDGSLVYVADQNSDDVSVINTATNALISTIKVGKNPEALGNFITSTRCSGVPVAFTITVNPSPPPVITATGSPSPLNTIYGTASSSTMFTVTGTNMTTGVLVKPPAGFEVSTDDITFSDTVTVGAAGNIPPAVIYIRLASSAPVGNYSGSIVLSSAGAADANEMMPVSKVNPAALTITADNKSKTAGDLNPVLTLTYSGFVNNDGPAQLSALPILATTALTTSPPGQYPITVSMAASPNYTFTYVPGVLTVKPSTVLLIPNTFTPNGDGINDTWNIKNLDYDLNCTVLIYNRYGENVYSSIGYATPWDGTYRGAALPGGTYYYIINPKNGRTVLSGSVTIIR